MSVNQRVIYSFENSLLTSISSEHSPTLYNIINKYGAPDEIWLSTVNVVRDSNLAVRLNLIYYDKGMAIGYVVNGSLQDDMITGCFAKDTGKLLLVMPNSITEYMGFWFIFEEDRHYLPLKEATGLTIDEFMELILDSEQSGCLSTSGELWD
ncbi:MAG TPA: hypothetical protein VLL52_00720 [Anaerolineae bacterium]|nr:hypothetical protein [Anaerolineae bacterium]